MPEEQGRRRPWPRPLPRRADIWSMWISLVGVPVVGLAVMLAFVPHPGTPRKGDGRIPESEPAPPASDWPAFQNGGALLGGAPFGPKPPLKLRWTFKTAEDLEGSAAVVDGVVYIGDAGKTLYALNLKDGSLRWKFEAADGFAATPLVYDGRVYIGDKSGVFYAISIQTGRQEWEVKTEAEIHSSANVLDGKIVFGSYDHRLYCVDPKTGAVIWKCETGNWVHCTPAVGGGRVYVAGCDERLTVVDGQTGVLFPEQTVVGLMDAIRRCEQTRFDPLTMHHHAQQFGKPRFLRELRATLANLLGIR